MDVGFFGIELALVIGAVLAFYMAWAIGANDVANAMGTSVGSGALTITGAVLVAGVLEFSGAFLAGGHVTNTIRKDMLDAVLVEQNPDLVLYGMLAALASAGTLLLVATRFGLPVSGSHSLLGGMIGSGLAVGGIGALNGSGMNKVLLALLLSPLFGLALGFGAMGAIMWTCRRVAMRHIDRWFGKLQVLSVSWMAFEHGHNDAQKAMGIITMALFVGG